MSMKKSVEIDKARSYQYLCTIDKMGDDKIKQMCDVGDVTIWTWDLQNVPPNVDEVRYLLFQSW